MLDQGTIERARAVPIEDEINARHIKLRRIGSRGEHIGPCPICGGTDRFSINTTDNVWHCRQCKGSRAGDVIGLVQHLDGCTFAEAVAKLVGASTEPMGGPNGSTGGPEPPPHLGDPVGLLGPCVAAYDYTDEAGALLFQVTRHMPKAFRQRRPDGRGGWLANTDGVRVVPYRLPDVLEAISRGQQILIVEGEKDADRLWELGFAATTNPRGAGNWKPELDSYFVGADVVVIGDADPQAQNGKTGQLLFHADGRPRCPGQDHADDVASRLKSLAASVRVIDLKKVWPECPPKGDVSDYLDAGLNINTLLKEKRIGIPANEFTRELGAIDFLVDDILLTGCVYSLTARPGAGKTTITLLLALCVSQGRSFAGREVDQGSVLYFAGENPDDVKRRWLAVCQRNAVDDTSVSNVFFVPGAYKFSDIGENIKKEMQRGVKLVVVDTSAVYFEGDDENDPIQMRDHALRMREILAGLPGRPTVVINCHPAKNATDESNLVPRGGGGFEASIDGNLYCKKVEEGITVHHTAKFRGVEFEPLNFQIISVTHERVKTVRGKLICIPVAEHVSDTRIEEIAKDLRTEEMELLRSVNSDPEPTARTRAIMLGWLQKDGTPYHVKVKRRMDSLKKQGLVQSIGGRFELTKNGQKCLAPGTL